MELTIDEINLILSTIATALCELSIDNSLVMIGKAGKYSVRSLLNNKIILIDIEPAYNPKESDK